MKFWVCLFIFVATTTTTLFATPTCDDSWISCIGSTLPCVQGGCWGWPPNPTNTPHKEVTRFLANAILTRNYSSTAFLFDPNACIKVIGAGVNLCGRDVVVGYLALPLITDAYAVASMDVGTMVQEGLDVFARIHQSLFILTKQIFIQPATVWQLEFNDVRQIKTWTIDTDTLQIAEALGQELVLNSTALCTSIQTNCQGANQQYTSVQACVDFMATLRQPLSILELGSGWTKRCRAFHNILAAPYPNTHCLHVGPQIINLAATPCTDPHQYA